MPHIKSVSSSPDFPKNADAVVIGSGVIGIATAMELQQRGLSVVVLEKGEAAAEQSSRNWGWCRQMGRDAREIPLIKVSLELWRGMNARIGRETGYRTCGILYLNETETEQQKDVSWIEGNAKPHGLKTRLLTSAETAALLPGSTKNWAGAMYTEDDGRAEPFIAVPEMAEYFKQNGGMIFTHCAARGIETSAGHASSVVTERGAIATRNVVLAGGYWSSRFLGNLGIRFPQSGVISSVMRTSPVELGHGRTFSGNAFAMRKRLDGGYTIANNFTSVADLTPSHLKYFRDFLPILLHDRKAVKLRVGKRFFDEWKLPSHWKLDQISPFEMVRILDPEPYDHLLENAASALREHFPAFKDMRIEEKWAGMIDATPDAVPVIDAVEQVPGLCLASGFSGHGFGLGPGAGKLMAEIITGEKPSVDPQPFRFKRFSDGSRPRPTTGL
jgi:glycine/D-amino acid oxidase-like deaminating enzyme